MTALERAIATEAERYLPAGMKVRVLSEDDHITMTVTQGRARGEYRCTPEELRERYGIVSEWARMVATKLSRSVAS